MTTPDSFEDRVRELLQQGQKIEAIKVYREATGVGLAEAKRAVEALALGEAPDTGDLADEVEYLLKQGRKIEAIKLYRERQGVGLKDAKDAVEALAAQRHIELPRSGCLGLVALSVLATATLAALLVKLN